MGSSRGLSEGTSYVSLSIKIRVVITVVYLKDVKEACLFSIRLRIRVNRLNVFYKCLHQVRSSSSLSVSDS